MNIGLGASAPRPFLNTANMKSMKFFRNTSIVGLSIGTFMLLGCGDGDLGTKVDTPPPSQEAAIKKIEDNPNMPPQAKEAAIGQMKAHADAGKAAAEAAKNAAGKK